ncbi:MAG: acyltransferase [Verrucomicrobiaceae bacterium]|nr:MAG: acyltransferase [Verrucomicrobiaceae bacterium]
MSVKIDNRNLWFDLIRGLSAVAVCASHLRNALLVDYSKATHPWAGLKFFYTATSLGHEAVMVFFVLSGYFVGGSVVGRGSRFKWGDYAEARLTRLWVVLIPALALTLGMDLIAKHFDPENQAWNSGPGARHPWSMSPLTALGNVFFLHTVAVPVFGSNLPLWSLAYEFWYYALFPLFVCALGWAGSFSKILRIGQLIVMACLLFLLPPRLLAWGLIWLLGVGVFYYPKYQWRKAKILAVVAFLSFVGALLVSTEYILRGFKADFAVGMSFAFLAAVLKGIPFPFGPRVEHVSRFLSEISYSLYVVHFPIMLCAMAVFYPGSQFQPDAAGFGVFAIWLAAALLAGAGFWWIFEKRTQNIRKWISRMRKNGGYKVLPVGVIADSKKN